MGEYKLVIASRKAKLLIVQNIERSQLNLYKCQTDY